MIDALAVLRGALPAADCTRRRVAAAVIRGGDVLSTGWNALPSGSCTAGACPRGRLSREELAPGSSYDGNCDAVHAEERALHAAGEATAGAVLLVSSPPCYKCAALIKSCNIATVVVVDMGNQVPDAAGTL